MWLHLPPVHAVMFTLRASTKDPVYNLIWYCVMLSLRPGQTFMSTGSWRKIVQTVGNAFGYDVCITEAETWICNDFAETKCTVRKYRCVRCDRN